MRRLTKFKVGKQKFQLNTGWTRICGTDDFLSYHVSAMKSESADVQKHQKSSYFSRIVTNYLITLLLLNWEETVFLVKL